MKAAVEDTLASALVALEGKATRRDRENLVRFAINPPKAFGVSMANLRVLAKRFGRSHELALALWDTGWYEARMLALLVDEPAKVSAAQMDRWCREFDNWAIVDTACFALFDRTAHAWKKVAQWSRRQGEFQKRAAFALLWALTVHDKAATNAQFQAGTAPHRGSRFGRTPASVTRSSSQQQSLWPCGWRAPRSPLHGG